MAVIRCPSCQLPMTDHEATLGACPACAAPLVQPAARPAIASAPKPAPTISTPSLVPLWIVLGATLAVAGGGMWHFSARSQQVAPDKQAGSPTVAQFTKPPEPVKEPQATAAPEPKEEEPEPIVVKTEEPAVSERKKAEVTLPREAKKSPAILPLKELPRVAGLAIPKKAVVIPPAIIINPINPRLPGILPGMVPPLDFGARPGRALPAGDGFARLALALSIANGQELRVNRPDGEFTVPPLGRGQRLKLIGKVKTLKVNLVEGRAILDASHLEASEIIVQRGVNDESSLRLNAPAGTVVFEGQVNSASQVTVNAPKGKVLFTDAVNDNSRLDITASDVEFRGQLSGAATHITITLTDNGVLKIGEITGQTAVHYRNAAPGLPDPRVIVGAVHPQAVLKKVP